VSSVSGSIDRQRRHDSWQVTGIVLAVFAALLILFFWMQFIVAQENESIGRAILEQTEELNRIERENMALRQHIAATCTEEVMAGRAQALGYNRQQPLYLLLNHPLVPAAGGSRTDVLIQPAIFRNMLSQGRVSNDEPRVNSEADAADEGPAAAVADTP